MTIRTKGIDEGTLIFVENCEVVYYNEIYWIIVLIYEILYKNSERGNRCSPDFKKRI